MFANFEDEDLGARGKQQIINNLVANLDLSNNSGIPTEILEAHRNDYVSFINSKYPVQFSFKKHYASKQNLEQFLIYFNEEVRRLRDVLDIKRIDGCTYLPLVTILIALSWDADLHYFLQSQ
ncbi:MAG: hypothetical protein HRU09_20785 [Oligoflexales bacterium]|nr:hypothetical protein [Oligoflexales bacterium]